VVTTEERLAFVEGRVVEQGRAMSDLREAIVSLERRMDQRFSAIDHRFAGVEQHMAQQFAALDQRVSALDARMASQFLWLVGLQVTTTAAIITAVIVR
jgi:uncharacterized coiled-coil protein SlyX